MATTLSQEWLPNLRFIVKYSENQPILAIFALPRIANISLWFIVCRQYHNETTISCVLTADKHYMYSTIKASFDSLSIYQF